MFITSEPEVSRYFIVVNIQPLCPFQVNYEYCPIGRLVIKKAVPKYKGKRLFFNQTNSLLQFILHLYNPRNINYYRFFIAIGKLGAVYAFLPYLLGKGFLWNQPEFTAFKKSRLVGQGKHLGNL